MIYTTIHYIYWFIIFFDGVFRLLDISGAINKISIPILSILLFIHIMFTRKRLSLHIKLPFINVVILFLIVCLLSNAYNDIDIFSTSYFIVYALNSYLYFLIIINETNSNRIHNISKCIILLCLLQIPIIIIKYIVVGQTESGLIGSLSVKAGSVSAIFPLLITAIACSYYVYTLDKKLIIIILFAVFFGFAGGKRAIIFFIPATLFCVLFLNIILNRNKYSIKNVYLLLSVFIVSALAIIAIAKSTPTLNPEHSKWGSFNLHHILYYTDKYTSSKGKLFSEMRRKEGFIYFTKKMVQAEIINGVLGDGPGKLIKTKYSLRSGEMLDEYGVRYGGRMGFIWMLIQVGFLGVSLYLFFIYKTVKFVLKNYKSKPIYLAYLSLTFVFFIDFFTYSIVFYQYEYLKGIYFFIFALIYLHKDSKNQNDCEGNGKKYLTKYTRKYLVSTPITYRLRKPPCHMRLHGGGFE